MINKLLSPASASLSNNSRTPPPDRLESWKEIASYLRREVRTVQLWEKREGLPVRRHFHQQLGSVFALRSEIDAWQRKVSERPRKSGSSITAEVSNKPEDGKVVHVHALGNTAGDRKLDSVCQTLTARTISVLREMTLLAIRGPEQDSAEPGTNDRENSHAASSAYEVRWILEKCCGEFRVQVHLQCSAHPTADWSHVFRFLARKVTHAADVVANQIAQCLWLKMSCASARASIASARDRTGARSAYLKGRYFWNQRSQEGLRKALQCFESAIREDAGFAPAYSGLADSLTLLSFYEIVSPHEAMPRARRAAHKAINLDPNLAEGHASLADILLHYDRDWQAADVEYRRSIQCNPGYALGYHWYANLLAARGQHEAAHVAIMQALELDPVSIITMVWAGVTSHLAHRFDDAIKHYRSALEFDSQFIWAHMYMAQALEQNGDFKTALKEFETAIQLARGNACVKAMKAHAHAVAGDRSHANNLLSELKCARLSTCIPSYDIAATHAALGESGEAMRWLSRACNERNMKIFTLTHDPRFDSLRNYSDFKEIVQQVGLYSMFPSSSTEGPTLSWREPRA